MNLNSLVIAYPEGGQKVKTIYENNEIYFSLQDVVRILASQNTKSATNLNEAGLGKLIFAQIETLEKDETLEISGEHYINQAGLFRIILRDNSSASKKFQKWVLHEVLPSIQKHGSYPPPVVDNESDVKKLAKLLLLEIEEREKLEREVKEKFNMHEAALNNLGERLQSIEHQGSPSTLSTIESYLQKNNIQHSNIQLLSGWCIKICAEENEPSSKGELAGKPTLLFPPHVIAEAIRSSNPLCS